MPSAQFETFEGKQIFFIDLRNAQPDEALKVIAEMSLFDSQDSARRWLAKQ